ncbi:Histone-lysine N-methyltransferase SETMAR [Eumeta japonica]|uniref:Histone-lysine N-methyltransferase SETMAR n=1 Tax=Eumeta variegata TaxID=151549 RepID=A0A4C1UAP5_EUMVA|nr:Histone-lysine N-methyltransferase SETMAR [Eumeta japonica]
MIFKVQCLRKTALLVFQMLLGREAPHLSTVSRWYAKFDRGRVSFHDEIREGRPSTAFTAENVATVRRSIEENRRITYEELRRHLGIGTRNFDVKDEPRSGRLVTAKLDAILEKIEQDRDISSSGIADERGIDYKTVLTYLKKAGCTKHLDTWIPHELIERNRMNLVLICVSVLKRNETEPF